MCLLHANNPHLAVHGGHGYPAPAMHGHKNKKFKHKKNKHKNSKHKKMKMFKRKKW